MCAGTIRLMYWLARAAVICLAVAAAALPVCAQSDSCSVRTLPLTVRDSVGSSIEGVSPADLIVKVRGKGIAVESLEPALHSKRAVILLDTSGSMEGPISAGAAKFSLQLAANFARLTYPQLRLAFLTFNEQPYPKAGFSENNLPVLSQLKTLIDQSETYKKEVKGRTALYDAIFAALQMLDRPSSSDLLLVISDGGENRSKKSRKDTSTALISSGVRFYGIYTFAQTQANRMRTPEEMEGPDVLQDLAEESGGEVFSTMGSGSGAENYFSISRRSLTRQMSLELALKVFYEGMLDTKVIRLRVPADSKKEEALEIKLTAEARKKWKDAVLAYPNRIAPCSPQEQTVVH